MTYQPVVGINPIYTSGSVTRWHANPDVPAQTLADHHGRVAQIICYFFHRHLHRFSTRPCITIAGN